MLLLFVISWCHDRWIHCCKTKCFVMTSSIRNRKKVEVTRIPNNTYSCYIYIAIYIAIYI